jgi:hypothetical protein
MIRLTFNSDLESSSCGFAHHTSPATENKPRTKPQGGSAKHQQNSVFTGYKKETTSVFRSYYGNYNSYDIVIRYIGY